MPTHHRMLAFAYKFFELPIEFLDFGRGNQLRVLLYHDIPRQHLLEFECHLRWLGRKWRFITPAEFDAMIVGQEPVRGRNLLLTFDDGYASNRVAAETVLAQLKISAIFFVISDFVDLSAAEDVNNFVRDQMFPDEPWRGRQNGLNNMRWSDLEALLGQGHVIGSHTKTHVRLSDITDPVRLKEEIVGSADKLAARLGVRIEHFAFPFGNALSVSAEALRLAQRRFKFTMSAIRGCNYPLSAPAAIRRDSLSPEYPLPLVGAFTEGLADRYYHSGRCALDEYVKKGAGAPLSGASPGKGHCVESVFDRTASLSPGDR